MEALPAAHQPILTDQTMRVPTNSAGKQIKQKSNNKYKQRCQTIIYNQITKDLHEKSIQIKKKQEKQTNNIDLDENSTIEIEIRKRRINYQAREPGP